MPLRTGSERARYDELAAADGDAAGSHFTKTGPRFRLRLVTRQAARLSPASVVDLGCGDGVVLAAVSRALPDAACAGLDWSLVALRRARARGCNVAAADLERPPLRSGTFDLAVSSQVLEHVADPGSALCQARALLRPGGRLLLTVPTADWHKVLVGLFAPGRVTYLDPTHRREWAVRRFGRFGHVRELKLLVESAGFEVESLRGIFYGVWRLEQPLDRWLTPDGAAEGCLLAADRLLGALPWLRGAGKYLMLVARRKERE